MVTTYECNICLTDIDTNLSRNSSHRLYTTPCGHTFHFMCIFRWCTINNSCPSCRTTNVLQFQSNNRVNRSNRDIDLSDRNDRNNRDNDRNDRNDRDNNLNINLYNSILNYINERHNNSNSNSNININSNNNNENIIINRNLNRNNGRDSRYIRNIIQNIDIYIDSLNVNLG